jgi:hypothetical protein
MCRQVDDVATACYATTLLSVAQGLIDSIGKVVEPSAVSIVSMLTNDVSTSRSLVNPTSHVC